jgi:hypothetical protein
MRPFFPRERTNMQPLFYPDLQQDSPCREPGLRCRDRNSFCHHVKGRDGKTVADPSKNLSTEVHLVGKSSS